MSIDFIKPLDSLASLPSLERKGTEAPKSSGFGDILSEAIGNAVETDRVDHAGMEALLSGEDIEPHTVMTQATEAELALNLAIQIRNKVLDAYNEMMRMSV